MGIAVLGLSKQKSADALKDNIGSDEENKSPMKLIEPHGLVSHLKVEPGTVAEDERNRKNFVATADSKRSKVRKIFCCCKTNRPLGSVSNEIDQSQEASSKQSVNGFISLVD